MSLSEPNTTAPENTAPVNQAARLAARIEEEINARQLDAGVALGTKPELAAHYGVGPEVFRQAARMLEQRGVAFMQRGKYGGLVVSKPGADAIAHSLATYFQFANVSFDEIISPTGAISALTTGPSAQALTLAQADEIRQRLDACSHIENDPWRAVFLSFDIRQELVENINNPVLALFHQAVMLYFVNMIPIDEIGAPILAGDMRQHIDNTREYVEAIIANDMDAATRALQSNGEHMAAQLPLWKEAEKTSSLSDLTQRKSGPASDKWTGRRTLADRLARQILRDIRLRGWEDGVCLGTETEILEQYGISRATFRQAVRLLEQYSAATMQRGPGGGLLVRAPDPDNLITSAATFLKSRGVTQRDSRSLEAELHLAAIDALFAQGPSDWRKLAAQQLAELDTSGIDIMQRAADNIPAAMVAETQNRALHAFTAILQLLPPAPPATAPISSPSQPLTLHHAITTWLDATLHSLDTEDRGRARRAYMDFHAWKYRQDI